MSKEKKLNSRVPARKYSAIRKDNIGLYNKETGFTYDTTLEQYDREQELQRAANAFRRANRFGEKFTFARMEAINTIISSLTTPQCGLFLVLQTYSDYEGVLRKTALKTENKIAMDNKDIMDVLGITKQTFSDFINKCIDNNFIIKEDDAYMLNNKYHFRGRLKKDDKVTKILNTEVRKMKGKINYANLGLLYRLIPHINLITNTICENPYEEDPTRINKLNQKRICELLGITKPTFNRLLDMEYEGKVVFAEVKIKRKYKLYLVNPWVFCRIEGKPNDSLIEEEVDSYYPDKTLISIFSVGNRI